MTVLWYSVIAINISHMFTRPHSLFLLNIGAKVIPQQVHLLNGRLAGLCLYIQVSMIPINLAVSVYHGPKLIGQPPQWGPASTWELKSASWWSLSLGHMLSSFSHCPCCVASVNTITNSPTAFVSCIPHCVPALSIRSSPLLSGNQVPCCQHSSIIRYSAPSPNKSLPGLSPDFTWLPKIPFHCHQSLHRFDISKVP